MTSWGGIVWVIVRSVTRTMRSAIGMSRTSPGPFWATSRPNRNTTPRSYSRSTRMDEPASESASATRTTRTMSTAVISVHLPFLGRPDCKREAVYRFDHHGAALGHGCALPLELPHACAPQRAVDVHLTDRIQDGPYRRRPPYEGR